MADTDFETFKFDFDGETYAYDFFPERKTAVARGPLKPGVHFVGEAVAAGGVSSREEAVRKLIGQLKTKPRFPRFDGKTYAVANFDEDTRSAIVWDSLPEKRPPGATVGPFESVPRVGEVTDVDSPREAEKKAIELLRRLKQGNT